ncbi:oxidoreductase [Wenzhouxiangella marina]|uniref:Quinone oxidoreductase n=1 Tax=Wenzhouxiangella marina TaxID=1579979 RepID=A0A0K0XW41_9GAMM|nr:oxidoreductase [Wenzhouxiangella marina]AKS41898.1 quinone oxidoreductase [Wenzhouxiangella marina]MBB6086335.1 putative YhdH/YhfP family quinone oxidoreductase [Wenzhouxiangella marina]
MSSNIPSSFKAFRIFDDEDGYRSSVVEQSIEDQNDGDVVVRVAWSSINYKDALAGTGQGKILRRFPLNGGIDLAGTVAESRSDRFKEGDEVLMTGCGLSETRDGGYAEYARVDSKWLVPLPEGLSLQEAMVLGTAGFTAALGLYRMEANGQTPEMGSICVTGATGGVGSLAVDMYSRAGYSVTAISGKVEEFDWLHALGAEQCISRHDLHWPESPLASAQFAGALDNVGGDTLSGLTRVIKPWGNIASCGMASGIGLHTTVMPFIIRGIGLLGINSAACPYSIREQLWQKLASDWKPRHLDSIADEPVDLEGLPERFGRLLEGGGRGRITVRLG